MSRLTKFSIGLIIFQFSLLIYTLITWVWNLILLIQCDFNSPWKDEVIRGIGVIIPPVNWVTVWMNF